jgi:hypothetical protein
LYLKIGLQAYKSRRADLPSWIVGGFATKEIIDRALFKPTVIDPAFTKEHVAFLGKDPGEEVDKVWWEDMLVNWFEEPEEEAPNPLKIPNRMPMSTSHQIRQAPLKRKKLLPNLTPVGGLLGLDGLVPTVMG